MKLDFHSHILPGIDDGATDINNAVQLATAMKEWGFDRVTCTPHITNKFRNTPETIRPAFEQLQEALYLQGIDLDLRMSAEYRIVPQTWPEVLEKGWIMPIEDRFVLMELPIFDPTDIGDLKPLEEFKKVVSMGLIPLLPILSAISICPVVNSWSFWKRESGSRATTDLLPDCMETPPDRMQDAWPTKALFHTGVQTCITCTMSKS